MLRCVPPCSAPGATAALPPALLVMGDDANERCGVGSSDCRVVEGREDAVTILDPVVMSRSDLVAAVRARPDAAGVVLVHPTRSQVGPADLVPKALHLRRALGRRWIRVNLPESDRFDRRQRPAATLVPGLAADGKVVCAPQEAEAQIRRRTG